MLFVFQIEFERYYLVRYELKGQGVDLEPKGILDINNEGYVLVYGKVDFENKQGVKVLKVSTPNFNTINKSLIS